MKTLTYEQLWKLKDAKLVEVRELPVYFAHPTEKDAQIYAFTDVIAVYKSPDTEEEVGVYHIQNLPPKIPGGDPIYSYNGEAITESDYRNLGKLGKSPVIDFEVFSNYLPATEEEFIEQVKLSGKKDNALPGNGKAKSAKK